MPATQGVYIWKGKFGIVNGTIAFSSQERKGTTMDFSPVSKKMNVFPGAVVIYYRRRTAVRYTITCIPHVPPGNRWKN